MHPRLTPLLLSLLLAYATGANGETHTPRSCSIAPAGTDRLLQQGIGGTGAIAQSSGIGGTGAVAGSAGIGGTGHQPDMPQGGIGGTGAIAQSSGIGGTGITTAGRIETIHGIVMVEDEHQQHFLLAEGDAVCAGDRIETADNGVAKIAFTDGANLYLRQSTYVYLKDYLYNQEQPNTSRTQIALSRGGIRSVSGIISKANPREYAFHTPLAEVRVIGTDFLLSHLIEPVGTTPAGTYAEVESGEISVQGAGKAAHLLPGQASHIDLNGAQNLLPQMPNFMRCGKN